MSSDPEILRRRLANTLLDRALDMPIEVRGTFLDERCEHDPALRDLLRSLLSRLGQLDGFLEYSAHLADVIEGTPEVPAVLGREKADGV